MDAGRFAAVYVALWAAHDLADHVVQTDHQARGKGRPLAPNAPLEEHVASWQAMAGHIGGYGVTQAVALGGLHAAGVRLRPGRALAGLALSLGTHTFLDRRWPVVELLRRTGSRRFASAKVSVDLELRDGDLPWATHRPPGSEHRVAIATGPLPLHGSYLADQALHDVCIALVAAVVAGRAR